MNLPPKWKIEREIARVQRQLSNLRFLVTDPINRVVWTHLRPKRLCPVDGDVALTGDVAIFLIYQPHGCPESLFHSLSYLANEGFATLVVSNQPINEIDKARLKKFSWKIVTRPNFGYDFGGYKDGYWLLGELGVKPKSLLFVNDTIWFPVGDGPGIFERLRARSAPYLGLTDALYFGIKGKVRANLPGNIHVTSFFFWLREPLISSEAFKAWWGSYPYSSLKRTTVRDGEVGFYKAMVHAGFSYDCIIMKADLITHVDTLDHEGLISLKERLSFIPSMFNEQINETIETAKTEALRDILRNVIRVTNTSDCLAYEGIHSFGFPFLKKTILKNRRARDHFKKYLVKDGMHLDKGIVEEIDQLSY